MAPSVTVRPADVKPKVVQGRSTGCLSRCQPELLEPRKSGGLGPTDLALRAAIGHESSLAFWLSQSAKWDGFRVLRRRVRRLPGVHLVCQ